MISEQATYLAYSGGWQAIRRMPESTAYQMFENIADLQWRRRTASVRRLEANLARPMSGASHRELRAASHEAMRSYMRYWCDAFRLPGWSPEQIGRFRITNEKVLVEAIATGRGVMLALPHQGNWDHAGAYVSKNLSPINTVAERLEPDRLFDAFLEFRQNLGMRIHGLGDPGVFDELAQTLRSGGVVALLADRDLSYKGIDVTFLGEAARFPAGPAALAVDTGAVLLPAELYWNGNNTATLLPEVVPPAEGTRAERIRATTQAIADALGEGIRRHPVDWHMLQRLFLADLDASRLAERDSAHGRAAGEQADGAEVGGV
jgi:lauroyl/myristoyl acyltransferase